MSSELQRTLQALEIQRKTEMLQRGWGTLPAWLFVTEGATPLDESRVRKAFAKILKTAKLPQHFTPHSLRHTFATLLIQQGAPLTYVKGSARSFKHSGDRRHLRALASDRRQEVDRQPGSAAH